MFLSYVSLNSAYQGFCHALFCFRFLGAEPGFAVSLSIVKGALNKECRIDKEGQGKLGISKVSYISAVKTWLMGLGI